MCCGSFWTALQILWSSVYVICGAVQVIVGVFLIVSAPGHPLICNAGAGGANIFLAIVGLLVIMCKPVTPRRQEVIFYIACVLLSVNLVNIIISEWGLYTTNLEELVQDNQHKALLELGCFATRITGALTILISFLDSQFAFCSMQLKPKNRDQQEKNKLPRDTHEQVSDIEYIIPRSKSSKSHTTTVYDAYAQSWVFESDNATSSNNLSPIVKVLHNEVTPNGSIIDGYSDSLTDKTHLIDNPVVHIEEASDESTSNSDRKLGHMRSFSRVPSPAALSAASSQVSLSLSHNQQSAPIYEYLEKLTEPQIYRSRLNSALSNKDEDELTSYQAPQAVMMRRVDSTSPRSEKVQYASLIQELQKAISKKEVSPSGSDNTLPNSNSSRQDSDAKNSDADFSKELEAALQLIQDLESPNTIDTPSDAKSSLEGKEPRPLSVWKNKHESDSEKTLNALGSLGEMQSPVSETPFKPVANGKSASIIIHYPDSQSTSGYSSPSHPPSNGNTPNWSATSSINGSHTEIIQPVAYSIHNAKSTTVISLYTTSPHAKAKSVTLVSISGDNDPISHPEEVNITTNNNRSTIINNNVSNINTCSPYNNRFNSANNDVVINHKNDDHIGTTQFGTFEKKIQRTPSLVTPMMWKSLLRKKKTTPPKLCPELEGAIIKSESLAYLSEIELLARHQRNTESLREIEERVIQQLGTPRTESNC